MKLVPKQKKKSTGRPADIVPVYFPDAKIDKLKTEIEKVISRHTKGMTYASILGILDMVKYETLGEWRENS